MAELTDTLNEILSGQTPKISRRIGADEDRTPVAVQPAIRALMAALSGEADDPGLRTALRQDHDGAIIDDLGSILGGEKEGARRKIPDMGDILDSFARPRRSGSLGGEPSR